jgi:antibiotic biosynthesis monooxygenase (ABM) superfamily enzyme
MNTNHQSLEPVAFVISEIVQSGRIQEYEDWVKGINQAAKEFEGFLGADVIRPRDHEHPEYVVLVRFDTYQNIKKWRESSIYQTWIEKSQDFVTREETHFQEASGLDLWFTRPKAISKKPTQPAYYKKVIMGILAVYPLILLTNLILGPLLKELPQLLGLFISVVAISALLTYPVMPLLTRLLNFWLYPSSKKVK